MKQCNKCLEIKSLTDFYLSRKSRDGRENRCKSCKEFRRNEPWRVKRTGPEGKLRRKEENLWSKYHITLDSYNKRLEDQGGVCAISGCMSVFRLSVDHDHACCSDRVSCGKCIRGIICSRCNTALGYLDDSKDKIKGLLTYLDNTPGI